MNIGRLFFDYFHLLLNGEINFLGLLLAYSGYDRIDGKSLNSTNATISAALLSNIWETFERQGIFLIHESNYIISHRFL